MLTINKIIKKIVCFIFGAEQRRKKNFLDWNIWLPTIQKYAMISTGNDTVYKN